MVLISLKFKVHFKVINKVVHGNAFLDNWVTFTYLHMLKKTFRDFVEALTIGHVVIVTISN